MWWTGGGFTGMSGGHWISLRFNPYFYSRVCHVDYPELCTTCLSEREGYIQCSFDSVYLVSIYQHNSERDVPGLWWRTNKLLIRDEEQISQSREAPALHQILSRHYRQFVTSFVNHLIFMIDIIIITRRYSQVSN